MHLANSIVERHIGSSQYRRVCTCSFVCVTLYIEYTACTVKWLNYSIHSWANHPFGLFIRNMFTIKYKLQKGIREQNEGKNNKNIFSSRESRVASIASCTAKRTTTIWIWSKTTLPLEYNSIWLQSDFYYLKLYYFITKTLKSFICISFFAFFSTVATIRLCWLLLLTSFAWLMFTCVRYIPHIHSNNRQYWHTV